MSARISQDFSRIDVRFSLIYPSLLFFDKL
jgi:hypothetical protein